MSRAVAGDIVSISGFQNSTVSHTLTDPEHKKVIASLPIEVPYPTNPNESHR
jgi:predicted membrane GTPase involved in stress response